MADSNLAVVLYGKCDLRLEEFPVRDPGPGEVEIRIHSVGLCGSDIGYWQHGRIGSAVVKYPIVMGHEPAGVVSRVGQGVTHLKIGDRVAVEPNQPCGLCDMCKTGHYNICDELRYLASPHTHGAMRRYHLHPAAFVYKIPDNMSFDEGALVQPLSLGFYAVQRAGIKSGDYVLVSGVGPLGMSVVLAAKASGAAVVLTTDLIQERLDYVSKIGADVTVCVDNDASGLHVFNECTKAMQGKSVDVAIECSGSQSGTANCIYMTKKRGVVVIAGFGSPEKEVPMVEAIQKELDIRGMNRLSNIYPKVINAIQSGKVNVKQLITHRFPLNQALDAYSNVYNRVGIKTIVDCSI